MPPTRRKSGNPTSTARTQQPLSFNAHSNRITKPSATAVSRTLDKTNSKKLAEAAAVSSPSPVPEEVDVQIEEQPTTAELAIRSQVESQKKEKTDAEARASKITDTQIKRYWKKKEDERKAPRGMSYVKLERYILPNHLQLQIILLRASSDPSLPSLMPWVLS